MNDTGWARASPWVQLVVIDLYGQIRESRVYISRCYFPWVPGFPQQRAGSPTYARGGKVGFIMCSHSLSFIFGFLKTKYFNILLLISTFPQTGFRVRASHSHMNDKYYGVFWGPRDWYIFLNNIFHPKGNCVLRTLKKSFAIFWAWHIQTQG